MKKMFSVLLVITMMLSVAPIGFAASELNCWSGQYSSVSFEGRDAVKVDGNVTVNTGMSFKGVVNLTADVYATAGATISLEDASGNQAGVITLANGKINDTDTAYNEEDWNTLSIFAMTGTKKYQVYLGETFVCEGNVSTAVLPSKVSISGSELYIDNLKITEMEKSSQYVAEDLNSEYKSSNFLSADIGKTLGGHENWAIEYWGNTGLVPNVTYQAAEFNGERVARFKSYAGDEGGNGIPAVRIARGINADKKNRIIDAKFYYPSKIDGVDNEANMSIYLDGAGQKDLISLKSEGISYDSLGNVIQKNAFPKDKWFTLRIEILYESQSYDVYIDNEKVNAYPIRIDGVTYGELPGFDCINLQLHYDSEATTEVYMKDFKLSYLSALENIEVFSENFDSETAKFTLTDGYTTESMTVPSGLTLTSNATTANGHEGKGRLYNGQIDPPYDSTYEFARVTEKAPLGTTDFATYEDPSKGWAYEANQKTDARFHSSQLDLSGAEQVTVKFKFYNAAMLRRRSNAAAFDGMIVTLDKELVNNGAQAKSVARPALYFWAYNSVYLYDKTEFASREANAAPAGSPLVYHGETTGGVRKWYDAELTITPGVAEPYTLTVNGITLNYASNGNLTAEDIAELKYLSFAIASVQGGCYYIDDVSVTKSAPKAKSYVKSLYEEAIKCFSEELVRSAVATVNISEGKIDSVSISYASEISKKSKVYVAVYDGNALSEVAVFNREASGIYNAAEKDLSVNEGSLIKVFCFENSSLAPQGIFQVVKN